MSNFKFKSNNQNFEPKIEKKTQNKAKIPVFLILFLILGIIVFTSSLFIYSQRPTKKETKVTENFSSSSLTKESTNFFISSSSSSAKKILVDRASQKITEFIKENAQKYPEYISFMGKIYIDDLESLEISPPLKLDEKDRKFEPLNPGEEEPPKRVKDLIAKPKNLEPKDVEPVTKLEKRNLLVFPAYEIEVPIIFLSFDDLFPRDSEGNIDVKGDLVYPLDRPICKNEFYKDICSPVQKKLEKGVVHIPFSVQPGEIGNSYIAGHTSNYNFINSPYNYVFKPIEKKSKVGEIFYIYDKDGRKLTFKVFESLLVQKEDITEAYRYFADRRVVTLQGSVLTYDSGVGMPTHRWLTRAELVLEDDTQSKSKSLSSVSN